MVVKEEPLPVSEDDQVDDDLEDDDSALMGSEEGEMDMDGDMAEEGEDDISSSSSEGVAVGVSTEPGEEHKGL
jgi:hypothetical protein